MDELKQTIQQIFTLAGFKDFSVEIEPDGKRASIFVYEMDLKDFFPRLIWDLEHLINLIAKQKKMESLIVDVNNYRRERERLIVELAKAAARKAMLNKENIDLPAMNAYERRLIHVELSSRPDIKTESIGEGKDRHVILSPSGL